MLDIVEHCYGVASPRYPPRPGGNSIPKKDSNIAELVRAADVSTGARVANTVFYVR